MVSLETMPSRLLSAHALKNSELLAKLNPIGGIASEQVAQFGTTIPEDLLTEIDAIEIQEIKGTKNDVVGTRLNGRRQRIKV